MRILFLGDIVGRSGRDAVGAALPGLRRDLALDLVVVNAENASHGFGLAPEMARALFAAGADVLTLGNHAWDRKEIIPYLEEEPRVIRPLNYPPGTPGRGAVVVDVPGGRRALVVQAMGRLFMELLDDPFRAVQAELAKHRLGGPGGVQAAIVDFHAEATSEKQAMGHSFDGRASLVIGTHTHVPTADARIGRGHMGVGADDEARAPVEGMAHGLLLGRGFGVEVHDRGLHAARPAQPVLRQFGLHGAEGVVEQFHEEPAHRLHHQGAPAARHVHHHRPAAGRARRVVQGADHARFLLEVGDDLLAVPGVIAQRQHIRPGGKQRARHLGRQAEAVRGVLRIHHHEVEREVAPQARQGRPHRVAPRPPHDIPEKEDPHAAPMQCTSPRSVAIRSKRISNGPAGTSCISCAA